MSPCIQLGSVWGRQISISEVYHSMASLAYTSHTSQPQLTAINKFFRRPNLNLHQDLGPAFGSLPHVRACCHIHIRASPSRRITWNLSEKHRGELMNFLIFLQNSLAARSCPDLFLWHFVLPRCYQLVFVSGLVFKLSRIQRSVGGSIHCMNHEPVKTEFLNVGLRFELCRVNVFDTCNLI